jgi:hypothetical protein
VRNRQLNSLSFYEPYVLTACHIQKMNSDVDFKSALCFAQLFIELSFLFHDLIKVEFQKVSPGYLILRPN